MKILHVSQEVPPETGWGGVGTYIGILGPALVAAGAEFHVLSVVRGQERRSYRTADGVVVHRAPLTGARGFGRATGLVETWGRIALSRGVAREVERLDFRPDVIESPNWNAEGLVVAKRRVTPTVVRLHSWASQIFGHFAPRVLDARRAIALEERLVRLADVVIGTQVQLDDAGPRLGLPADRLRVIPPPVAEREARPIPRGRPTVLFVGRLEARKGPETIVRAMPGVMARVPNARFVLVGRDSTAAGIPSYSTWLKCLAAELGVGAHLEVRDDHPSDDEVTTLRDEAAVCVMPSRWESFGYVAAEGLAAARPVVASDVGGLREIVDHGKTGYRVPPEDSAAWADALIDLLSHPDRATMMGQRGAEAMRARYAPAHIAAVTLDAYDLAISHFHRSPVDPDTGDQLVEAG